ncbi:MAG: cytochrome C oxidase subunit IV family protein [Ignavibacteriales bacterium]|nr:cytochrome C oxidase subunit IV family protein [Ignavibacteriales bacterium]
MTGGGFSRRIYYAVGITLLVLFLLTVGVAYIDLGALNIVVAMAIATFKTILVVLYFMHVRYSSRVTWVFVSASFFWLVILLVLTLSDYVTRGV